MYPRSDHERRQRPGAVHDREDAVHVLHVAQGEDARVVHAGDGRADGLGAGAQDQGVVGVSVLATARPVVNHDLLRVAVDPQHLGVHAHVQVEPGPEALRRLDQQPIPIGDDARDVVRQAAVREGHVGAPLEDRDLGGLGEPPGPRGGTRTRRRRRPR